MNYQWAESRDTFSKGEIKLCINKLEHPKMIGIKALEDTKKPCRFIEHEIIHACLLKSKLFLLQIIQKSIAFFVMEIRNI